MQLRLRGGGQERAGADHAEGLEDGAHVLLPKLPGNACDHRFAPLQELAGVTAGRSRGGHDRVQRGLAGRGAAGSRGAGLRVRGAGRGAGQRVAARRSQDRLLRHSCEGARGQGVARPALLGRAAHLQLLPSQGEVLQGGDGLVGHGQVQALHEAVASGPRRSALLRHVDAHDRAKGREDLHDLLLPNVGVQVPHVHLHQLVRLAQGRQLLLLEHGVGRRQGRLRPRLWDS
mmetsp:Transcript_8714/g.24563  ORF Transcript_8714/g.24563 Transcript_8714/m.24563 type:complete len:231 (+) Transcript_8714:553-1245(+)